MSTKTMRPPPRRVAAWASSSGSTPTSGSSSNSKRKERDNDGFESPNTGPTTPTMTKLSKPDEPRLNNQLLAGYMAHEFLTKGTLLGRRWGPTKSPRVEPLQHKYERYVEVVDLLKTDGAHLSGVVNPTQLAQLLRLF